MRLNRFLVLISIALLQLFCVCKLSYGDFIPSFSLELSAWNATDIVVVKQVEDIVAIESWKGGVAKGTLIQLPGLPQGNHKVGGRFEDPNNPVLPTFVTGDRIVLFLVRDGISRETGKPVPWMGASLFSGAQVSAVWLHDGHAFAFQQWHNPGPRELVPLMEAAKFEAETRRIMGAKQKMEQALQLPDVKKRVALLSQLAREGSWIQRNEVIMRLGLCGEAAVGELRKLTQEQLDDDRLSRDCVAALAVAAGASAEEEMTNLIVRETKYWKNAVTDLPADWSNKLEPGRRDRLLHHHFRLIEAISQLGKLQKPSSKVAIMKVRDYWAGTPVLLDHNGNSSVLESCDYALKKIDDAAKPKK